MSGFLLDTHVWFWYLIGSIRLPTGLRQVIDEHSAQCWLSPVTLWELGMLAHRGRVRISGSYRDWAGCAQREFPLREASLNREVALRSLEVDLPHRDPADRFLAATALVFELTLLTVDTHLVNASWLLTRSS
ncbi:MAG: type II toxin-antitoxin system VapC family toxin [Acidobacteriota bacterium]